MMQWWRHGDVIWRKLSIERTLWRTSDSRHFALCDISLQSPRRLHDFNILMVWGRGVADLTTRNYCWLKVRGFSSFSIESLIGSTTPNDSVERHQVELQSRCVDVDNELVVTSLSDTSNLQQSDDESRDISGSSSPEDGRNDVTSGCRQSTRSEIRSEFDTGLLRHRQPPIATTTPAASALAGVISADCLPFRFHFPPVYLPPRHGVPYVFQVPVPAVPLSSLGTSPVGLGGLSHAGISSGGRSSTQPRSMSTTGGGITGWPLVGPRAVGRPMDLSPLRDGASSSPVVSRPGSLESAHSHGMFTQVYM